MEGTIPPSSCWNGTSWQKLMSSEREMIKLCNMNIHSENTKNNATSFNRSSSALRQQENDNHKSNDGIKTYPVYYDFDQTFPSCEIPNQNSSSHANSEIGLVQPMKMSERDPYTNKTIKKHKKSRFYK